MRLVIKAVVGAGGCFSRASFDMAGGAVCGWLLAVVSPITVHPSLFTHHPSQITPSLLLRFTSSPRPLRLRGEKRLLAVGCWLLAVGGLRLPE